MFSWLFLSFIRRCLLPRCCIFCSNPHILATHLTSIRPTISHFQPISPQFFWENWGWRDPLFSPPSNLNSPKRLVDEFVANVDSGEVRWLASSVQVIAEIAATKKEESSGTRKKGLPWFVPFYWQLLTSVCQLSTDAWQLFHSCLTDALQLFDRCWHTAFLAWCP